MKRPPGTETGSFRTVNVLSVSPSEADHAVLCNILRAALPDLDANCRWMVYHVNSLASMARELSRRQFPIVISADDCSPGAWQTILRYISPLPDPPLLIVTSRLADERLWAEALNLGAWDVLAKPLDTQEVIRVVASAWRHWQASAPAGAEGSNVENRLRRSSAAATVALSV